MSNYYADMSEHLDRDETKRCAERLQAIRQRLIPLRELRDDRTLLLATWNIRDFDSNKFGYGYRLPETFYYLAEMIAPFDLVAVQEVGRDLRPLQRVLRILGRDWDYIVTDVTEGSGGNGERMAFLFNRDKVHFRKIAGEVVLPNGQLVVAPPEEPKSAAAENRPAQKDAATHQFARSPFLVAFQAGWFKFSLCTVHIYYGTESGAKLKRRIDEIQKLVAFFANRQDTEVKTSGESSDLPGGLAVENYILLGDFNVVSPEHETMAALKARGFVVPDAIDGDVVRDADAHYYDQIAVRVKDHRFKVTGGGMLDIFEDVFTDDELDIYKAHLPKRDPDKATARKAKTPDALYKKWRTWQMSDHSPLWIAIDIDFADDYLRRLAGDTTEA